MLQTKLQNLYQIEDENDELKATLDRLNYENTGLKRGDNSKSIPSVQVLKIYLLYFLDMESRDELISELEGKLSSKQLNGEDYQQQINDLINERQKLQLECQELLSKFNQQQQQEPVIKVASLGASSSANKKSKTKRTKTPSTPDQEDVGARVASLAAENESLKTEKSTLEQRIELLMAELSAEHSGNSGFEFFQMPN